MTLEQRWNYLEAMGTKEVYRRMRDELINEVSAQEKEVNRLKQELSVGTTGIKQREDELYLEVEGSNAEQRKAALTAKKKDDDLWGSLDQDTRRLQAELDEAEVVLGRLNREWSALGHFLRLRTAQITFLGGS